MTIVWTSDLDTGIDVIDAQHRQLVDYINQLEGAATAGDRESIAAVFDELVEYTMSHFAFEEQLQVDAGYVFANAHKSIHDVFIKRLDKYRARFEADEDVHRTVASEVFHVPLDQVTKDQRGQAKTINFGIIYGVSAYGLARRIEGLDQRAAQELINAYNKRFPSIKRFLEEGNKVKVTLMFRGRQIAHPELGRLVVDRVATELAPIAKVETEPRLEGKSMTMILAPR